MRQALATVRLFWTHLPSIHKYLIAALTMVAILLVLTMGSDKDSNGLSSGAPQFDLEDTEIDPTQETKFTSGMTLYHENYLYTIAKGDTLSTIFSRLRIPQSTMYQILDTDQPLLALDTLQPGDKLRFWISDKTAELTKLEIEFSLAHKVLYERVNKGGFEYKEIILPGDWEQEVLAATVYGSFYVTAKKVGLSANNIMQISSLFKQKMNFNKGFRKGDKFEVVRSKQLIDGKPTGNTRIEGIRIQNRGRELTAFLFKENYYDKNGVGLERAFSRYPVSKKYRISSHFNPKRRHPITKLIRPHNGTDFATPKGTPVYATGDGVVIEVKKHRYAGLYIKLQHGQKYRTRFLHLQKSYVRKGQTVSRGQKIALSGNSGRSTGAHLHFELHVNGRPVNAMKAAIPIMKEIDSRDKSRFKSMVAKYLKEMKTAGQNLNKEN